MRLANAFRLYLPVLAALARQLALPRRRRLRPRQRPHHRSSAPTRASRCRARFRDYEDFCRVADQLIAAAGVDDYTYIWWDVRPHPNLGTVEVRAVDVQADAASSAALAALIQAIAAKELDRPSDAGARARGARGVLLPGRQPRPRGARSCSTSAQPRPAREVARAVLDAARPYARELGARGGPRARSSGSCARATAPKSSAASTPSAAWTACSRTSPRARADPARA